MLQNKKQLHFKSQVLSLFVVTISLSFFAQAAKPNWQRKEVDWRMSGGKRIKAIKHPKDKPVPQFEKDRSRRRKSKAAVEAKTQPAVITEKTTAPAFVAGIGSPPVDGFVPWIVVVVTDSRGEELELDAIPRTSVVGNYPLGYNPLTDYVIGICDSGASANIMGNAAAIQSGLFTGDPDLVTENPIDVSGVTGSVEALVSMPLGIFVDGLGAVGPTGQLSSTSGMVGETNTSILVGQGGGQTDLPTAIGAPLLVYFNVLFRNDQPITITRNNEEYTSPAITFYAQDDPSIPKYSQIIPLELRPLGGVSVQYIPTLDIYSYFDNLLDPSYDFYSPQSPSVIIGNLSQSVFFVHSVDLTEAGHNALDRKRFMFDSGAQVTVIGSRVAARLSVNPNNPEFIVEIQGVTGDVIDANGFYIDSLQIPALGEWLTFTDVPVILLDVPSPEGGTIDGIIGMNLFTEFNMVLRGGGLFLQDDPRIELQPISRVFGDIAPTGGDGIVNYIDLAAFAMAWAADPTSPNWNSSADLFGDAKINFLDFAVLAGQLTQ